MERNGCRARIYPHSHLSTRLEQRSVEVTSIVNCLCFYSVDCRMDSLVSSVGNNGVKINGVTNGVTFFSNR